MESWFYVNLKSFLKEFMFLIQLSLAWFNWLKQWTFEALANSASENGDSFAFIFSK